MSLMDLIVPFLLLSEKRLIELVLGGVHLKVASNEELARHLDWYSDMMGVLENSRRVGRWYRFRNNVIEVAVSIDTLRELVRNRKKSLSP